MFFEVFQGHRWKLRCINLPIEQEMVEAEGVAPFWWGVVVEPFRRLWWTGSYRVPEPVGASSSRFRLVLMF